MYPKRYIVIVSIIKKTKEFDQWLKKLRDVKAKVHVIKRIARIEFDNFGDHKSIGDSVSEIRIDYGPGYRIYYTKIKSVIVLLLIGGDKSTQSRDIEKAKKLMKEYEV